MSEAGKLVVLKKQRNKKLKFPQYNRIKHFPNTEGEVIVWRISRGLLKDVKVTHWCPMPCGFSSSFKYILTAANKYLGKYTSGFNKTKAQRFM